MTKQIDTPKDMPVLIPTGKRPSLKELSDTGQSDLIVDRVLGKKPAKTATFNSSI